MRQNLPVLFRTLILRTAALKPVERLVRRSRLFRGLVGRFIAGDDLADAIKVAEELSARGFKISLDLLGENTTSPQEARKAVESYLEMLRKIGASPCAPVTNISIKLTQCGLDLGDEVAESNFREVLFEAQSRQALTPVGESAFQVHGPDNFVRIDMEDSRYTERTIVLMEKVWADFKNTGTVLQSYLHRTPEDVETMIRLQMRTRLVKGAYLEPEEHAIQDKGKVDEAYLSQAKRMMEAANYPAFATHDEIIIGKLKAYAQEKQIPKERYEFQMLYGIRRDLQDSLLAEGYNVRVYIPFGDSWYPYFTRRLAERPANLLFIMKSLAKG